MAIWVNSIILFTDFPENYIYQCLLKMTSPEIAGLRLIHRTIDSCKRNDRILPMIFCHCHRHMMACSSLVRWKHTIVHKHWIGSKKSKHLYITHKSWIPKIVSITLPKFNIAPKNWPGPKRKKTSLPTIHFQVLLLLVSGRLYVWCHIKLHVDHPYSPPSSEALAPGVAAQGCWQPWLSSSTKAAHHFQTLYGLDWRLRFQYQIRTPQILGPYVVFLHHWCWGPVQDFWVIAISLTWTNPDFFHQFKIHQGLSPSCWQIFSH